MNATYYLPLGKGSGGWMRAWLGGWQVNGIVTLASGSPFSTLLGFDRARSLPQSGGGGQRPDLAPGRSSNPVLGSPDRYFDPLAFLLQEPGFFGNLGRNTIIGPGTAGVDFSLIKELPLSMEQKLQVRVEAFNVMNRANFAVPQERTVFASGGVRVGSAGRIRQTTTSARQIQLGLKFFF
jgi:hypothetical protein